MSKREKVEVPTITMTYKDLNCQPLASLIQKFEHAQVDHATACRLRRIIDAVKPALIQMEDEYINGIQKPHQERMLAAGFDVHNPPKKEDVTPEMMKTMRDFDQQLQKEQSDFGTTLVTFEIIPLGPQHFKDMKISAAEIKALGPLYDESGSVRQGHFQQSLGLAPDSPSRA